MYVFHCMPPPLNQWRPNRDRSSSGSSFDVAGCQRNMYVFHCMPPPLNQWRPKRDRSSSGSSFDVAASDCSSCSNLAWRPWRPQLWKSGADKLRHRWSGLMRAARWQNISEPTATSLQAVLDIRHGAGGAFCGLVQQLLKLRRAVQRHLLAGCTVPCST